ncbi:O-acetyltransferase OatA [Curvibacter sp. AEP1-3]|uniref:acyltransferase family protein n=1 Tax=Curvibacter sp. AEP1-3 TaxID=1844971 RepID=UPI000B3C8594|nr:acyltransferase family protein [Curvibacter sp. AEP1-3]ARV17461.1 O-acetyltransferase OatA [Curvibacter sp. AEP1-3]
MSLTYRADVDGLRAVAILIVVAFHAFPDMFPGGFIGVDVFFVISGYLITSILRHEMQTSQWSLVSFYARRILRIFPALILVLFACLVVGWHTLLAPEYMQLGKHLGLGTLFLSNIGLWWEAGYFDKVSEAKPLLHLWSLAIEEQFYIVWPIVLWVVLRFRLSAAHIVSTLGVFSLLLSAWWVWIDPTQAFYSPLSRAWQLLAGAYLALNPGIFRSVRPAVRSLSVIGLLLATLLLNSKVPFPGLVALLPVVAAMILVGYSTKQDWTVRLLAHPWMVAIGKVSYPWYLWHWPLLSFAYIIESGNASVALRIGLVLASLLLAVLTYKLWELPMRRFPRRIVISLLLLGMVVLGLLGKNIHDRYGLERIRHKNLIQLDQASSQDFLDFEKQGLITDAKCEKPFKFPEREVCLLAHADKPVSAVVLGDSHAVHAFWGLAKAFDALGLNLAVRGKGACVPVMAAKSGTGASECERHMETALRDIARDANVRAVALVFRGRYLTEQSLLQERQDFEGKLDATLSLLQSTGKQVYYFLPVVEPGFDPRLCLGALPLGRKPPYSCVIDKTVDDVKSEMVRTSAARVLTRWPQVRVVDPNTMLCLDGKCPILRDGHSIFKDENHLSRAGSMLLSESLNAANH